MRKPIFLSVLLAGGAAFGALADRSWNAAFDEGASCDFVRAPVAVAPSPLPVTVPCAVNGRPGTDPAQGFAVGRGPADCPRTVAKVLPAATLAARPARDGDDRTTLVMLGGLLGLVGLGAAWRQVAAARRRKHRRLAAGLVPAAAFARPAALDDPAAFVEPTAHPAPHPAPIPREPVAEELALPVWSESVRPDDRVLRAQARRQARQARKAKWRRLLTLALGLGSVAAIAGSAGRTMFPDAGERVSREIGHQVRRTLRLPEPIHARPDRQAEREAVAAPPAGHGPGAPRPGPVRHAGAPLDAGGAGGVGVGAGGPGGPRVPGRIERFGEGNGAHMFDGRGAGDPLVFDPRHAPGTDHVKSDAGGGSSGGGGSIPGGASSGGASSGSASSGGGSSGGSSSGGGSSGGSASSGGSSGGPGGGGSDNWLGTDGGHGGSTPVPEPDTVGLLALGIFGLVLSRSRRLRERLSGIDRDGETPG